MVSPASGSSMSFTRLTEGGGFEGTPLLPIRIKNRFSSLCSMHALMNPAILFIAIICATGCGTSRCEVENLGFFVNPDTPDIVGLDGCASILVNKTVTMWTFGDTIIGRNTKNKTASSTFEDVAVIERMLSNSLAFTEIPDDDTVESLRFHFYRERGSPSEFIHTKERINRNIRIWPVDGVQVDRRVYLYYYKVAITGEKAAPFRLMGTGIATWDIPEKWRVGDPVHFKTETMLFNAAEPAFGDSVILKDNQVIITGHRKKGAGVSAFICRVDKKNILSRKDYQILDSEGAWSKKMHAGNGYFNDVAGELSLSFNEHLKKYVIIYCSMNGSVKTLLFDDFEDLPKTLPTVAYIPPPLPSIKSRPLMMYYSGKEILQTAGSVYAIFIDPSVYQPILLKIPHCYFK